MATPPRIVIVGAGIVGCALADELTRRGCTRVTVLDQGPPLADRRSDALPPGLVFRTGGNRTMTRLADATAATYARTAADGAPCFRPVGGLEVAATPERLTELQRRHDRATGYGIGSRMLDAAECATLHPLIDPSAILGGRHVPGDGLARQQAAAEAQARAAIGRGATFLAHRRVVGIDRSGTRVRAVRTGTGERFDADVVVSCAGVRGPLVGGLAGVAVPLVPMVHRYAITSPVDALETVHALESLTGRADAALPILRHPDAGLYLREHGDRIGVGAHGRRARPVDPAELDAPRPDGAGTEPGFTTEDVEPSWAAAVALLPALRDSKVEDRVDVIDPVTPDGMPLLGEHPALGGFWSADAVSPTHAAGVAEAVAEWITTGRPALGGEPIDLSCAHPDRFGPAMLEPRTLLAHSRRAFERIDDTVAPQVPAAVASPVRTSPFHSRQVELRAVPGPWGPWWFEANAGLPEVCETPRRRGPATHEFSPVAGAEALLTRRAAGLYDLSPLRRVEVTGPDACAFLTRITTGRADHPVGTVTRTLMLDDAAGVRTDLTVTRLGPQRFALGFPDRLGVDVLRAHARPGVTVRDVTDQTCSLGLWGPSVHEVLDGLVPGHVHRLEASRASGFRVGTVPVTGLRVSPVGEYGWELHAAAGHAELLWDTIVAAGARHGLVAAGWLALSSLRMECGHRLRGADLGTEHDPDASGLGGAVDMDKGPFLGRAALRRRRRAGAPARALATLVLDHPHAVLSGQEPVHDVPAERRAGRDPVLVDTDGAGGPRPSSPGAGDEAVIGYVASAAVGYTVGESIARAWLPAERARAGTRVEIGLLGRRIGAQVVADAARHAPPPARART